MKRLTRLESSGPGTRAVDKGIVVLLISAAAVGVLYFLAQADESFLYLLSNGLPPLLAFAAFIAATAGLLRSGVSVKNRLSIAWVGYAFGMLLWLLGESTWAVYSLWYSVPIPYPSPADVFWLAGYVPLMCATVMMGWPFRDFFSSRRMLTVILAVFVLAGVLLVALIPPAYTSAMGQDLATIVVGLSYPMLDVVLLFVSLPIVFLFGRGTFWRPFLFVTVGLILTFVGDVLFNWATLSGVYYDGSYLELFFHWSYLTLAYGFYLRFRRGTGTNILG